MSDLAPCPFCGTSERDDDQSRGLDDWLQLNGRAGLTDDCLWSVECFGCGTEGRTCDSEDEAIEHWNRRTVPTSTGAVTRVRRWKWAIDPDGRRHLVPVDATLDEVKGRKSYVPVPRPPDAVIVDSLESGGEAHTCRLCDGEGVCRGEIARTPVDTLECVKCGAEY